MKNNNKMMFTIRFDKDDYNKIRMKAAQERISIQKLVEVLLYAYDKSNKEIMRLVQKYVDDNGTRRSRNSLDQFAANELLRLIEQEHSPLRNIENSPKEKNK